MILEDPKTPWTADEEYGDTLWNSDGENIMDITWSDVSILDTIINAVNARAALVAACEAASCVMDALSKGHPPSCSCTLCETQAELNNAIALAKKPLTEAPG